MSRLVAVLCVWLASAGPGQAAADTRSPLTIFAAASLTEVLEEVAGEFTRTGGPRVIVVTGASSALARQIESGAPADIFASAHVQWLQYLSARGLLVTGSAVRQATTELVLVAPAESRVPEGGDFAGQLLLLLGDAGRLAVGDPDHVPAGLYAKQALEAAGLWSRLAPRLARAENVRAALALVSRGEAAAGLVYRTDLRLAKVNLVSAVPRELTGAVGYDFAAVNRRIMHPQARGFLTFLTTAPAHAVFLRHGFDAPAGN